MTAVEIVEAVFGAWGVGILAGLVAVVYCILHVWKTEDGARCPFCGEDQISHDAGSPCWTCAQTLMRLAGREPEAKTQVVRNPLAEALAAQREMDERDRVSAELALTEFARLKQTSDFQMRRDSAGRAMREVYEAQGRDWRDVHAEGVRRKAEQDSLSTGHGPTVDLQTQPPTDMEWGLSAGEIEARRQRSMHVVDGEHMRRLMAGGSKKLIAYLRDNREAIRAALQPGTVERLEKLQSADEIKRALGI